MEEEGAATASASKRLRDAQGAARPVGAPDQGPNAESELQRDSGPSVTATHILLPGDARASVVDLGGQGNCGWLALAFCLARAAGAADGQDLRLGIQAKARTLRSQANRHLAKNEKRFRK
eukprot:6331913-Alexandrium_andersonii.AAC.1